MGTTVRKTWELTRYGVGRTRKPEEASKTMLRFLAWVTEKMLVGFTRTVNSKEVAH